MSCELCESATATMVVHNHYDSIGVCSDCYAEIKPKVTAAFPVSALPSLSPAPPSASALVTTPSPARISAVMKCLETFVNLAERHPKLVYENFVGLKKTNGDVVDSLVAENPQFAVLTTLSNKKEEENVSSQ